MQKINRQRELRSADYSTSNQMYLVLESGAGNRETNLYLFRIYSICKHRNILEAILKSNLRLVTSTMAGFHCFKEHSEDMYQAGSLGLLSAIEKYDYLLGFAFSTFAIPYIAGFIHGYIQKNAQSIYLPANILSNHQRITKTMYEFSRKNDRNPNINEINSIIPDLSIDHIKLTLNAFQQQPISLDAKKPNQETSPLELTADPNSNSNICEETAYLVDVIQSELNKLDDLTKRIINLYYVSLMSQREVAETLNVSQEQARLLLKKGFTTLKRGCQARITIDKYLENSSPKLRKKIASFPIKASQDR